MPWLVATAFLHSVMVQERKGMLKVWNISLISAAFALSIFGTFLTRSGILSSIHAVVASDIGWYFMVGLVLIIGGSFALIMWRLPRLRADQRIESLVSREATFLFNNLLLVGIAFAVLWGVVYPLLTEALGMVRESVSTPFYEFFVIVFGLPLLLLGRVIHKKPREELHRAVFRRNHRAIFRVTWACLRVRIQNERRKPRLVPQVLRHELIERDRVPRRRAACIRTSRKDIPLRRVTSRDPRMR
jgi:cytochrome c biogenesis factor